MQDRPDVLDHVAHALHRRGGPACEVGAQSGIGKRQDRAVGRNRFDRMDVQKRERFWVLLQVSGECGLLDDEAPTGVDEDRVRRHSVQQVGADKFAVRCSSIDVDGEDVRAFEEFGW